MVWLFEPDFCFLRISGSFFIWSLATANKAFLSVFSQTFDNGILNNWIKSWLHLIFFWLWSLFWELNTELASPYILMIMVSFLSRFSPPFYFCFTLLRQTHKLLTLDFCHMNAETGLASHAYEPITHVCHIPLGGSDGLVV